jgi:hypothetical protein
MPGMETSQEETQKNRQLCRDILALSPKIRYAGILNKFGRTLAGQLRKGVVPLLKPDESRNEHFIEATRDRLRKDFEASIGNTEYTFTENEKVKILTLSNETNFFYITFDKDIDNQEALKVIGLAQKLLRQDQRS